jgi:hypothetical protein
MSQREERLNHHTETSWRFEHDRARLGRQPVVRRRFRLNTESTTLQSPDSVEHLVLY